jgi:hypothetical protein
MNRMTDDQLRAALRRRDPAAGQPADVASGTDRALWEQTMSTAVPTTDAAAPARSRRRLTFALAAAALAVLAGVGTAVAVGSRTPDGPQQMVLQMPDSSVAAACTELDIASLRDMQVALQGTAVEVTDASVVLRVDRWFRGGRDGVTTVRLSRLEPGISDGGFEFTAGKTYLVAASQGRVNGCGYTDELNAELLGYYEQAF